VANDYSKYPDIVYEDYPTAGKPIPQPSRPFSEGVKVSSLSFSADSGHEQRRKKGDSKRTFQLTYNVLTADQYKTIRDFFMVVMNVYEFSWTPPMGTVALNVKFSVDTLSGENFAHGPSGALFKLQFSLEQVW